MSPIADMFTQISNAIAVNKKTVSLPFSKMKYNILKVMEEEGFIEKVIVKRGKKKKLVVKLKYFNTNSPALHKIKLISKPSRHIYLNSQELYFPKRGHGILILSTSKGIITSKKAKKEKIGGEVICEIW